MRLPGVFSSTLKNTAVDVINGVEDTLVCAYPGRGGEKKDGECEGSGGKVREGEGRGGKGREGKERVEKGREG